MSRVFWFVMLWARADVGLGHGGSSFGPCQPRQLPVDTRTGLCSGVRAAEENFKNTCIA